MVKGFDKFKQYFALHSDLFIVIGGTAMQLHGRDAAVDALNVRYGKGKVFSARLSLRSACSRGALRLLRSSRYARTQPDAFGAGSSPHGSRPPARVGYAQGLGARSWHMKRQKLSRRPTTRWDELMTVR